MQTNLRQIGVNGDSNPRPNHCVRYYQILFPIHPTLEVCALFTILSTVYLACLMRNEIEWMNLDLNYFNAKIMRVIVPSAGNGSNSAYMYGNQLSIQNNFNHAYYPQLLLLRFVSKNDSNRLYYYMKTLNTNDYLWDCNVELRNNGTITSVTFFDSLLLFLFKTSCQDNYLWLKQNPLFLW